MSRVAKPNSGERSPKADRVWNTSKIPVEETAIAALCDLECRKHDTTSTPPGQSLEAILEQSRSRVREEGGIPASEMRTRLR